MAAHAFLPPSGSDAWVACSRWPHMLALFPELGDRRPAERGTLAAEALHERLSGRPEPIGVDEDMRATVDATVGFVQQHRPEWVYSEQTLEADPRLPAMWGTPDVWWHQGMCVDVVDQKDGHLYVPHVRNWQLTAYALLIAYALSRIGVVVDHLRWRLTIVQPHCFTVREPVRTWETTTAELQTAWAVLIEAGHRALQPGAPATSGSHCRDCVGRMGCRAFLDSVSAAIDYTRSDVPEPLDIEGMEAMLRVLRQAKERLLRAEAAAETTLIHRMSQGERGRLYALGRGTGRSKTTIPLATLRQIEGAFGVSLTKEAPLTPAQMRAALKAKGHPPEVLDAYTETPGGALTLIDAPTFTPYSPS